MFSALLALLPSLLSAGVTAWNKSKDLTITAITSSVGVASAQASYMKEVLGHPLSAPSLMCYALAGWFFKAAFLDKVIGPALGYQWYTDPLTGGTKEIAMIVCSGMFFSGIAAILKR
jgi:hypothetical protein